MDRIKLTLPTEFIFETSLKIRITDLNYGGHVGNDNFLSLIHEARQEFLFSLNYTELNIEGIGLIMADVAIEFKKELNYNDIIFISVTATSFDKLGFDIYYKLELQIADNSRILAGKAKTGMICFDYTNRIKCPVPEKFIKKINSTKNSKFPN